MGWPCPCQLVVPMALGLAGTSEVESLLPWAGLFMCGMCVFALTLKENSQVAASLIVKGDTDSCTFLGYMKKVFGA